MPKTQKFAALVSLVVSFIVLSLKVIGYYQTQSSGVLSDALETVVNVVTAVIALIVLKYALEPADEEHPYGHGKLEYFSAAFEGGIILFAAIAIILESIRTYLNGYEVKNILVGIGYIAVASIINLIVGLYLINVGRKNNSETLKASGLHLMADVKTTAGVIVGLLLYKLTGLVWVDSLVGVLVGVWLGYEAIDLLKRNVGGLLDATDFESLDDLSASVQKHHLYGIIDIHNLRIIRSGAFHHIDAHVVVPEFWDIKQIHELTHQFESLVVKEYKYDGEFAFHTDPCYQNYCRICSVTDCPQRKKTFDQKRVLTKEHMIKGPQYTENSI